MSKPKVLLIIHSMALGGGEKLCIELATFCQSIGYEPHILVLSRIKKEYHDDKLPQMGIKLHRINIYNIRRIMHMGKFFKALFWKYIVLKNINSFYKSVHVIGVTNLVNLLSENLIPSEKVISWHITNRVQYTEEKLAFPESIFQNKKNHFVLMNPFQKEEILSHYKDVQCQFTDFKLFIHHAEH